MAPALRSSARDVFRQRSYARFWLMRACSSMSYQMFGVAVGWQLYALTHSTFALGMVGLLQFLPLLLLMLPAGHIADRIPRHRILSVCQCIEAVMAASLGIATLVHHLSPAGIFAGVILLGVARAFENPSSQALGPSLVEEAMLPQAVAWSSSANQTAMVLGPAIGGLLYIAGAQVPYFACAMLWVCACAFAGGIQLPKKVTVKETPTAGTIFSGIHYIREHKNILGAISLDLFAVLLGGATALLPAYARDLLHTGSWGLGLLRLSPAVGALTTSVILAHHPLRRRTGARMFTAVIVFGGATVAFALSHYLWLSMLILIVLGCADTLSVNVRQSLVQLETPNEMRGRVSAVNMLFIGTSNQLGEFESGVTASWFGLIPATIIGGVGSIVIALAWMGFFPGLRKLDRLGKRPA